MITYQFCSINLTSLGFSFLLIELTYCAVTSSIKDLFLSTKPFKLKLPLFSTNFIVITLARFFIYSLSLTYRLVFICLNLVIYTLESAFRGWDFDI